MIGKNFNWQTIAAVAGVILMVVGPTIGYIIAIKSDVSGLKGKIEAIDERSKDTKKKVEDLSNDFNELHKTIRGLINETFEKEVKNTTIKDLEKKAKEAKENIDNIYNEANNTLNTKKIEYDRRLTEVENSYKLVKKKYEEIFIETEKSFNGRIKMIEDDTKKVIYGYEKEIRKKRDEAYALLVSMSPLLDEAKKKFDQPIKNIETEKIQLGHKWKLSGVGDAHHNDDWLRLMNQEGTDYYGGFAAGKLWSGSDIHTKNVITEKIQLGKKWNLSGVGEGIGNDDWLRLMDNNGKNHYGGFAAARLWSAVPLTVSDISLKSDVKTLKNSLEKIRLLRGVSFKWKNATSDRTNIGLIAQEVEKIFPEVVSSGPQGKKGINYSALIAPLINSVKEQDEIINRQNKILEFSKNSSLKKVKMAYHLLYAA